jgi:hypothetical protein
MTDKTKRSTTLDLKTSKIYETKGRKFRAADRRGI